MRQGSAPSSRTQLNVEVDGAANAVAARSNTRALYPRGVTCYPVKMNARTRRWFDEYAASHRHPTNRLTHTIAIPMIVFHIFAMMTWIDLGFTLGPVVVTGGALAWVVASVFWVVHLPAVGGLLAALTLPIALWGGLVSAPLVVALAVVGWLVQLAGHAIWEKNRPAFLDNLLQALVGPLYFLAVLTGAYVPAYASTPRSAG